MEYVVSTLSWVTKDQMTELIMAHMKYAGYRPPTRSSFPLDKGAIGSPGYLFTARPGSAIPDRPSGDRTQTGWLDLLRDKRPDLRIQKVSDLGGSQQDFLLWKDRGQVQLLMVSRQGSDYRWEQLRPT